MCVETMIVLLNITSDKKKSIELLFYFILFIAYCSTEISNDMWSHDLIDML